MTSKLLDAIEVVLCLFFAGVMVFLMITALWRWAVGYGKGVEGRFHIVSQADQYLFIHDYSAVRMCCVCNEIPSREYQ